LTLKQNPVINSSRIWSVLQFRPTVKNETLGELCFQSGYSTTSTTEYARSRFIFRQHSYDSTTFAKLSEKYEDYYLPNTSPDLAAKASYDILTTKDYCYYPNDNITLTSGWGYVSAEGKSVEVWFPVAKYLNKVFNNDNIDIKVTLMKGNIRAGKTYWVAGKYTAGGHDFTSIVTSVSLIPEQKLISVILTSTDATTTKLGSNNSDEINLNNFTVQFNGTLQISFANK
jgi:hypothetical protein